MRNIDPTTLAVIRGALEQIADEMDTVLSTSAFSPIISDAWDRASGIFHPRTGEVIVQGQTGLPIFIIVMQHTVQHVLQDHPPETMKPGDVFIVNDPYRGGTHTMDVKFVRPFFRDGELKALLANTGHWPDVGSMTPGGFTTTATDVYQEGFRIPPVKIYDGGEFNQILADVMFHNMRVADDRRGDMAAQLNSLEMGDKRLHEFFDRFDEDTIFACIDELKDRSEKLMRERIAGIPDGTYEFVDHMDSDGLDEGRLKIDVKMIVKGTDITFDLSGSSLECRGPFNSPYSNTVTGTMIAVKHVFWDVPINSGCFEPFNWIIPEGSMLNPREPRPVFRDDHRVVQHDRQYDARRACPGRAGPRAGRLLRDRLERLFGRYASGLRGVRDAVAGWRRDGRQPPTATASTTAVRPSVVRATVRSRSPSSPFRSFTRSTDYAKAPPAMVNFAAGSASKRRCSSARARATSHFSATGARSAPYGLEGGEPGATADHVFHTGGEYWQAPHRTKIDRVYLKPGDGMVVRTPGGGGYGDPAKRSPKARAADSRRGYLAAAADAAE